jgi:hypothetical protein
MANADELSAQISDGLIAIANGEPVIPTAKRLARLSAGLVSRDRLVSQIQRVARVGRQGYVMADLDAAIKDGWKAGLRARAAKAAREERAADVKRTAAALFQRTKYLRANILEKTSPFVRAVHIANASDISDGAFRQFVTFAAFADGKDLSGAYPSHETVALITGRSVTASERATTELSRGGWIETEHTRKGRRGPAVRNITIPQHILDSITDEVHDPSYLTGLKSGQVLDPSKKGLRPVTGDGRTVRTDERTAAVVIEGGLPDELDAKIVPLRRRACA